MKLMSPIDVSVLTWLKPELDSTLSAALSALERYVEAGRDVGALHQCAQHLHQVAGILVMLELPGAARLAEEMEQLANALGVPGIPNADNALALLMQCIIQLPDYLERLQAGHRDVPTVLLPLINELRSIRGEHVLGEETVYSAPIRRPIPDDVLSQLHAESSHSGFPALAQQFQQYLNAWLNDSDAGESSRSLALVSRQFSAQCREESSQKLFWVAAALFSALSEQSIALDDTLKNILAKTYQEAEFLSQSDGNRARTLSPVRLLNELLFFVARDAGLSSTLRPVYQAFALADVEPNQDEIAHAKSSLLGRNNALLDSVAAVIKEDILRVKDSLDLSRRRVHANPTDLADLVGMLARIENTLGLLDAEPARVKIRENREIMQAHIAANSPFDETEWMAMAQSLLSVELMLGYGGNENHGQASLRTVDAAEASQSHQLLDAIIRESIVNFMQVRQAYVAFVESYWDHQQLLVIPDLLKQVSGALSLFEHTSVVAYIEAINAYTCTELINGKSIPTADRMEQLAEVLASLEYYLESVRDRHPGRERILEITRNSLQALHYWPIPQQATCTPSVDEGQVVQNADPVAVAAEDVPVAPVSDDLTGIDSENRALSASAGDDSLAGFNQDAEGIDDEIRQVFLEELSEELVNLESLVSDWQRDIDNMQLLRPIRRIFHTLKGSGRLVGARALAEFSWKIESLLNRVLEGGRPASDSVVTLVKQAIAVLPEFQKALQGIPARSDVASLSALAERLAAGEEAYCQPMPESEPGSGAELPEQFDIDPAMTAEPIIDPVLFEVLKPEVSGHLQTVNDWLQRASHDSSVGYDEALFRAIHTMNGAFAMSEVAHVSEILSPAEALVRRGISHKSAAGAEAIAGLAQLSDALAAALDCLSRNAMPARLADLESWLVALRDALPEPASAAVTPLLPQDDADEQATQQAYGMSLEALERLTDPGAEADALPCASHVVDPQDADLQEFAPVQHEQPDAAESPTDIVDEPTAANRLDVNGLDEELLDIFAEEAKDLLDQSDRLLVQLRQSPGTAESLLGLQRHLHTLKGGARMAGLFSIGELSHSLESFIQSNADHGIMLVDEQLGIIERALDALHRMASQVEARETPESPEALIQLLNAGVMVEPANALPDEIRLSEPLIRPLSKPIEMQDLDADEGLRTPQDVVRIRADLLEQLVNSAGEVAIFRARLEQQLVQFKSNLLELEQTTTRLREQLRRLDIETEAQIAARNIRESDQTSKDFDPLELDRFTTQQQLSRSLAESSNDLINLQSTLNTLARQHEALLLQQSRVSSDLQDGLMRTRMVPFETLLPRLRRVLRQASDDCGKPVELRVEGAHGELDRSVLDRMTAPLEHLLRNAVAHGIEAPEQRHAAGKPEIGRVMISVSQEGTEVLLSVRDDGHGLDITQIRNKALQRGMIAADAVLSHDQILALITQTGFSTAETVTRLSGRGVGLDVVSSEIRNLNGSIGIQSTLGRGTEFIIRLPLNLALTKAVFVKIGESQFAIPIASVDGVGRIGREELTEKLRLDSPEFNYAGNVHKIYDLGALLGLPAAKASASLQMPMLLSKSGQERIAICVDQVLGSQEIVVKPVGPQVTSVPGVYGACIMPDGGVMVILDLVPLVRHNAGRQGISPLQAAEEASRSMPLVMVVDDSITMRKVTSRILERNNFEVVLARDGLEAIEKMAEQVPDLVLLDIEMPRMDGYEVVQNMKSDARLQQVPVMMITSRTGDKHRQRAFDLGVERYLGKPYQEFELMRQINDIFKK